MLNSITGTVTTGLFPALSPEKQKKADDAKQILQQTLETLKNSKNSKSDVNAQRKAMAAQRVAQIKQALQNLQQVAGMDPKAMARMIAMLAKQLAAAVKDYKAAGGSDASVSATSSSSAPVSSAEADSTSDAATIETDAGDMADIPPEVPQNTNAQLSVLGQTNAALNDKTDPRNMTQQQKMAAVAYGKSQNVASTGADKDKSADKQQDSEFMREVGRLAAQMKGMIEAQRQRIKSEKKGGALAVDPDYKDVRAATKALDEVDKALQQIRMQSLSA